MQNICEWHVLVFKRQDFKKSVRELNEGHTIIKKWSFQWKMDFNHNPKKQAIKVCFSRKIVINIPSPLSLNQSQVKLSESHKHLGLIPDTKLKFLEHFADKKTSAIELLGP